MNLDGYEWENNATISKVISKLFSQISAIFDYLAHVKWMQRVQLKKTRTKGLPNKTRTKGLPNIFNPYINITVYHL